MQAGTKVLQGAQKVPDKSLLDTVDIYPRFNFELEFYFETNQATTYSTIFYSDDFYLQRVANSDQARAAQYLLGPTVGL